VTSILEKFKPLLALGFLAVLSAIISSLSQVGFVWGLMFFLIGMYLTIVNKNKNGEAHIFAAYIMGAEVFFRMSWSGLPWEFGKYAVVFLLLAGLIFDPKKRSLPYSIVLYFLLMLVTVPLTFEFYSDFTLARKRVIFNLLGPFTLMVSTLYFYQLKMTIPEFTKLSRAIIYGVFSMAILVLVNVGDYSTVEFTFGSNFDASGGFSGNQVATAFGLAMTVLGVNMVLKNKVFYYAWIDMSLFILFTFQAFMTFSRGGLMGGVLGILAGAFVFYFSNISQFISFMKKNLLKLVIAAFAGAGAFMVADDISGGNLYARYFNVREDGSKLKEDYSTGRGAITKGDFMLFSSSDYVGVGPGVSVNARPLRRYEAAHVEYTRMFAEHGLLGIISIIIMFLLPLKQFFRLIQSPSNELVFISYMVLSLLTMTHAAMRLGMVGFFYGMAFIVISNNFKKKEE